MESEKKDLQNINTFICEKCNYSTNIPSSWIIHTKTKKHLNKLSGKINNEKKEYHCECCNITVYHLTNWNIHLESQKHKREGKPKNIECTICNHKFINHITQKHHMLSAHSTKEERSKEKYYCDVCDLVFISKLYMDKHTSGKIHNNRILALNSL